MTSIVNIHATSQSKRLAIYRRDIPNGELFQVDVLLPGEMATYLSLWIGNELVIREIEVENDVHDSN